MTGRILLGAGIIGLGVYAYKLRKLQKGIVIETSASVSGKNIVVVAKMKNPTSAIVTVRHPFVKIFIDEESKKENEPMISSKVEDKIYKIKPHDTTTITVKMPLGFGVLLSAPSVYKQLRAGKMTITVVTETEINGKFPYSKEDKIPLTTGK